MGLPGCVRFDVLVLRIEQSRPSTRPRVCSSSRRTASTRGQDKSQVNRFSFLIWVWIAHPSPNYVSARPPGGWLAETCAINTTCRREECAWVAPGSFCTAGGDFYCYYLRARMQTDAFLAGVIRVSNTRERLLTTECKFTATRLVSKVQAR